jgi:hypothetical protein
LGAVSGKADVIKKLLAGQKQKQSRLDAFNSWQKSIL